MITICTRTTCEYFRSYTYCAAEVCPFPTEQSTTGSIWNIKQPITNADRIRAMTDEELAEWVRQYGDCILTHCCAFDICVPTMEDMSCKDWILKWLKMEGEG